MALLGVAVLYHYLLTPVVTAAAAGMLGRPIAVGSIVYLRNRSFPMDLGLAPEGGALMVLRGEVRGGILVRAC